MENSCCANYRKKNDTSIHPKCDGSDIGNDDPKECCYNDWVFAHPDCDTKMKRCLSKWQKEGNNFLLERAKFK